MPCTWPAVRLTARVQDRNQPLWQLTTALKQRIEELLETGKQGARIGAIKAVQRIILVQTRASSDPRVGVVMYSRRSYRTARSTSRVSL